MNAQQIRELQDFAVGAIGLTERGWVEAQRGANVWTKGGMSMVYSEARFWQSSQDVKNLITELNAVKRKAATAVGDYLKNAAQHGSHLRP